MKTYSRVPDECSARVTHLLKCFHGDLIEADVKIDLLSVATDGDEPALKLNGYPCLMVVRVVGLKDRAKGHGDAEIVIDEEKYRGLSDAERDAALDHELYHIELQIAEEAKTKDGTVIPEHVVLDAQGRPKLKLRKHDTQFGWFREIAERHGTASQECKQAAQLVLTGRQTFFAFISETVEPSEKVRNLAARIETAGPSTKAAVRCMIDTLRKSGVSMTMRTGDTEAKIS